MFDLSSGPVCSSPTTYRYIYIYIYLRYMLILAGGLGHIKGI